MSEATTGSDTYRPDPAAEVAMLLEAFFAALADSYPDKPELVERLRRGRERLVADQQDRVTDEPSRHNLAITLAVLAAYQELAPGSEEAELTAALERAFVEPMERFVRTATRSMLDAAADPFTTMVALTRDREQHAFGEGFVFTHPEDDPDRYTAQVERCFYHEVLKANGAERLTPIFCAFDSNWIEAIDPSRDGFEFDGPTTIGTGGPNYPFRFRRVGRTTSAG